MFENIKPIFEKVLDEIKAAGLYKNERIINSEQAANITLKDGTKVLNLCANNYLGLSNNPELKETAKKALDRWGYGMSSVRFICGTQDLHKQLEQKVAEFLGTEDTILYSSCFDANGGLFETILTTDDAIISDELNHASIIDGVRLCKAQRYRYKNNDMADLEAKLIEAKSCRIKLIATDGVFSMDGTIANLQGVCDLAEKYGALVMVDDSHAAGVIGKQGRGSHEYRGVMGRVNIITGTFGKAFGGASGGYTSGRKEIINLLRQRSRPYLFSNTMAPVVVAGSLKVMEILSTSTTLQDKLRENTKYFRQGMKDRGFNIPDGDHPICPIMLGDAVVATKMADMLLAEGIYVIGFSYPVVPKGKARIRVQISAALSQKDLDFAMDKFALVAQKLGILNTVMN